jgi:hypothetical protein
MTICAWVNGAEGTVFCLDEASNAIALYHDTNANTMVLYTFFDGSSNGYWTFPITDGVWQPIAITYDRSSGNAPIVRVNFVNVTVTHLGNPDGDPVPPDPGYCVGNTSAGNSAWNGKITQVQVFNRMLSPTECDACSKDPGSVRHALRLWLPMTSATDVGDRSGHGFDGTGTSLETGSGPYFDTRFFFGIANETRGQIAIPSNGTEPAIEVRGVGTRTRLTPDGTLTNEARFITTKGHTISQSTVIEPTVRDLYLFGNQSVKDQPWANETGSTPVCHAIALDGDAPTVKNCKIFDFKGDAIAISNTTAEFSRMVRIPRVTNNKISHCWNGIVAGAVDAQVDGNRIASVRHHGILATAGSVQCSNNHVFGATTGIEFRFGPSRSVGDRFSDSATGFYVKNDASGSDIIGGTTEHCWEKNIDVRGQRVHIADSRIFVAPTGNINKGLNNDGIQSILGVDLHIDGSRAVMSNCELKFHDPTTEFHFAGDTTFAGSTGVFVQQHNVIIRGLRLTGSPLSSERAVRVQDDRNNIYIEVDSGGNGSNFAQSGDAIVYFDNDTSPTWSGIVYVTHEAGETPVKIPANWTSALQIWTRENNTGVWTPVTTGTAQGGAYQ